MKLIEVAFEKMFDSDSTELIPFNSDWKSSNQTYHGATRLDVGQGFVKKTIDLNSESRKLLLIGTIYGTVVVFEHPEIIGYSANIPSAFPIELAEALDCRSNPLSLIAMRALVGSDNGLGLNIGNLIQLIRKF